MMACTLSIVNLSIDRNNIYSLYAHFKNNFPFCHQLKKGRDFYSKITYSSLFSPYILFKSTVFWGFSFYISVVDC